MAPSSSSTGDGVESPPAPECVLGSRSMVEVRRMGGSPMKEDWRTGLPFCCSCCCCCDPASPGAGAGNLLAAIAAVMVN